MHLIPNHLLEQEMLDTIGVASIDELFDSIPRSLCIDTLSLPEGTPERQLVASLRRTLGKNRTYVDLSIFLGGGAKPQPVPAAVRAVAHRQEFITSYTPYQPEVSQGLLQALFEYQSLMADITSMEVVNSSMYDGHSALGEAGLMAKRVHPKRTRFLVPEQLDREKRSVLANYVRGVDLAIESFGFDDETGQADLGDLEAKLGADVAGIYLENPNRFGIFEPEAKRAGELAHASGALFAMGIDPTSLGAVRPPGTLGADIVVGDASCFGGAPAYGGPLLGLFATREGLVRKMPGRIIGATHDENGRRGFVMTLQAREQHIRRAKATSNICTNEAIMAVQAAIHLSMLGRTGLRDLSLANLEAGDRLARTLAEAGLGPRFTGVHYNELVTTVEDADALHEHCLQNGVHAGVRLGQEREEWNDWMLWGASAVHGDDDFTNLAKALAARVVVA